MGQEPEVELATPGKVSAPPGSSATAVAIPAGNASSVPMWQQEKQGAKCCGCCCDYRRAVIVLAIINICFSLGYVVLALTAATIPGANINIDDDEVIAIWEDGVRTQSIFAGITLAVSILTLVGALKYNIYLVAIDILWIIGNFVAGVIISIDTADEIQVQIDDDFTYSVIPSIVFSAVISMLFIYPDVGFIMEVRAGIMTPETYPREEFSCCCTPARRH